MQGEGSGAVPAEGIARVAQAAYDGRHGGGEIEPLAGLWVALEGLVKGSPELRFDALARMSRDVLVLVCAQAEAERHIIDTPGADTLSNEHYQALYMAAAVQQKRGLRRHIIIEVEALAESGWSPPWPDEDDDQAA